MKNRSLKHICILAASLVLVSGCKTAQEETRKEEARPAKTVSPLPLSLTADNLKDCTVAASFTSDDFRWMGGSLEFSAYEELLYDAFDLSDLREGDTLVYLEQELPVLSVSDSAFLEINGGFEQGGATLISNGGGTYRAIVSDDHSLYRFIATVELPLSQDFTIHDCGEQPSDPVIVITEAQKPYFDLLEDYRREFQFINTRITIENGEITDITRIWIP